MTVESTTTRKSYDGNDVSTMFVVPFKFLANEDLVVILHDTTTGEDDEQILDTDYTVTGAGSEDGGAVTFTTAPAAGKKVVIYRDPPITQTTDWLENDPDPAEVKERAFDKLTMIAQRLDERVDRSVRLSDGDTAADMVLPAKEIRAGKYAAWDADGAPTVAEGTSDPTPISPFMAKVLDDATSNDALTTLTATRSETGAVAVPVLTKLREAISLTDFGPVGDDATDDYTALVNALSAAAGNTLYVPAGTYKIVVPNGASLTPGANTRIVGAGKGASTLHIVTDDGTARTFWSITSRGVIFEDIGLHFESDATGGSVDNVAFSWSADDLSFIRCFLDGSVADAGAGSLNHRTHFIKAADATDASGLLIRDCELTRFRLGFFKTNGATSTQQQLRFLDSHWHDFFSSFLALNTPNGSISDVHVEGNTFENQYGASFGTTGHQIGGASIASLRVIGNRFAGVGSEAVHIEEAARDITITGNDFKNEGDGVFIIDNNISGTSATPQWITITGNSFVEGGVGKTARGIELGNDGGDPPSRYVVITGNTFRAYDVGIFLVDTETENVYGNTIHNCNTAIRSTKASPNVHHNKIFTCTNGLVSTNGGAWGFHTFETVTTIATVTNGHASLLGYCITKDVDIPASGTDTIQLLPAGSIIRGLFSVDFFHDASNYISSVRNVKWDGATFTDTDEVTDAVGSVTFGGFTRDVNSNLVLQLTNTGGSQLAGGTVTVILTNGKHTVT